MIPYCSVSVLEKFVYIFTISISEFRIEIKFGISGRTLRQFNNLLKGKENIKMFFFLNVQHHVSYKTKNLCV